ncbi:hypothetical protein ACIQZB_43615 [Streptomyces sp. NPDC097727]|uniref:hypothetical protein n=1 Tax=Streptomyces sp. NPDC097727 TaxID=3366092 RepID=UPI0037FDB2FC
MTDKTPADLAGAAADAVRALNHATLGRQADWEYPGDAYSVVANLSQMAMTLPQAIDQVRSLVEFLNAHDNLRSDKGTLDDDLAETFGGLGDAKTAAEALYAALSRAHSGLGPIGYQD